MIPRNKTAPVPGTKAIKKALKGKKKVLLSLSLIETLWPNLPFILDRLAALLGTEICPPGGKTPLSVKAVINGLESIQDLWFLDPLVEDRDRAVFAQFLQVLYQETSVVGSLIVTCEKTGDVWNPLCEDFIRWRRKNRGVLTVNFNEKPVFDAIEIVAEKTLVSADREILGKDLGVIIAKQPPLPKLVVERG